MGWMDSPVLEALAYFGQVLGTFITFAQRYGWVMGTVGLLWTAFRLINARIGVKEMLWDTIYKWVVYLLLISCYSPLTNGIMAVANEAGAYAGGGSAKLAKNIGEFAKDIKSKLRNDNLNADKMIITMTSLDEGSSETSNSKIGGYNFSGKATRDKINESTKAAIDNADEKDKTIWGARTLASIDKILVARDPETGEITQDYTNAYFSVDLNLRDAHGSVTPFLAPSSLMNVGIISGQLFFDRATYAAVAYSENDDNFADLKGWTAGMQKDLKVGMETIKDWIIGIFGMVVIVLSVICAIIQYAMTIIEFVIIQGIGAFFIPFYLFDGTKDMPKKLIPVFTGLLIKILVITICLNYVFFLWLDYTAQQLMPEGAGVNATTIASVLFIAVFSYILTSNAPKISTTLLTGQPQLSMGEFIAGAVATGATMRAMDKLSGGATLRGAAGNAVGNKIREGREQHAAQKGAERQIKKEQEASFEKDFGTRKENSATKADRKAYDDLKKEYMKNGASERKSAGKSAVAEIKEQQKRQWEMAGGARGEAGRMLAHYGGQWKQAASHPIQFGMQGSPYQGYNGGNTMGINQAIEKAMGKQQEPPAPVQPTKPDENKKGGDKNGLPENLTGNERTV